MVLHHHLIMYVAKKILPSACCNSMGFHRLYNVFPTHLGEVVVENVFVVQGPRGPQEGQSYHPQEPDIYHDECYWKEEWKLQEYSLGPYRPCGQILLASALHSLEFVSCHIRLPYRLAPSVLQPELAVHLSLHMTGMS